MALGSIDILTILILPNDKHRISFHLFAPSSISFIKVLQFSMYISFTSLVKFIPKYFIMFDAIVNGIVFFVPFSCILLLECKNAIYYSILHVDFVYCNFTEFIY